MEHEQFCKVGLDYEVEEFRVMTYGIEPNGTRPKYPEIRIKGDKEYRWYDARRFAKVQS